MHYALNATLKVGKNAMVYAHGNSRIKASERSVVHASDSSEIVASDISLVVSAKDNSKIELCDHATCMEVLDNAELWARGSSSANVFAPTVKVCISDYAIVRVYLFSPDFFGPSLGIDYNKYSILPSKGPILYFVIQKDLFTKDEELVPHRSRRRTINYE